MTTIAPFTIGGKTYTQASGGQTQTQVTSAASAPKTNPVVSSTPVRADVAATGADIQGLRDSYSASNAVYQQEQTRLAAERTATIGDLKTQSEIDQAAQAKQQGQDYAARSTSLVTSGGGFLGATQSQEGVLQNLKSTFDSEHQALIAKRDAAINAANSAYNDKDFAVAKELANNAKDLQNDIYKRQSDYADQTLKIAQEKRAQTEFDLGITDKKVASYAQMSDADFANVSPADIAQTDALYYPGYTANARTIAKKALDIKNQKDAVSLDSDIMDMRLKMPYGQKFTLGGQTYTGLKTKDSSSTQADKDAALRAKITQLFSPGYTVPGTDSNGLQNTIPTPILDTNGYATPEGWKSVMKVSGLDRADFIKQYGYLINTSNIKDYGLTNPERDLVIGKI